VRVSGHDCVVSMEIAVVSSPWDAARRALETLGLSAIETWNSGPVSLTYTGGPEPQTVLGIGFRIPLPERHQTFAVEPHLHALASAPTDRTLSSLLRARDALMLMAEDPDEARRLEASVLSAFRASRPRARDPEDARQVVITTPDRLEGGLRTVLLALTTPVSELLDRWKEEQPRRR
jgi:hypothetical protein